MADPKKEEEYDPHYHRATKKPTSYWDTLSHFLKGSIGSGILAMPMAFKNAGLYFGVVLTVFVSLIVLYCVHILVNASHVICKRLKMPQIDFGQVAEKAVECGPERMQKYSRVAKNVTNAILMSNLLGLCIVYVIFVAVNIQDLIEQYAEVKWNIRLCILLTLIGFLPVNMIRELKYLVPFSWLANVLLFTGLITTFVLMCLGDFAYNTEDLDYIAPPAGWPMFLGTVVFALEAIAIVLPLENKMENPASFVSPFGVVNVGLGITMIMYILIGFMGYFKYGPLVEASVTMNLVPNSLVEVIIITIVKVIITIAIFLTYCIQFYGFMDITKHAFGIHHYSIFKEYIIRVCVIIGTVLVAIALPDLGPFITLVGALCLSVAGLILPPIIECIVYWIDPGMGKYYWRLWKNGFLVAFGILAMVSGTVVSIIEFINLAKERQNE